MKRMELFVAAGGGKLESGLERALNRGRALAGQLERALAPIPGEEEKDLYPEPEMPEKPAQQAVSADLAEAVAAAVREGMQDAALRLDAEALGRALIEPLSRGLARQAYARRYGA